MTWNVQAHAPIGLEDALPRLEFIAFAMLKDGEQTISGTRLRDLLASARRELPEALSYSQLSDAEFINRIEFRSSLLIQAGHTVENGRLTPIYEFRHLTFQEYLAARAIVEGHYPDRSESDNAAEVLKPFLGQESWVEVIPMTAVLAGREARAIIRLLIDRASTEENRHTEMHLRSFGHLLVQCLLDEPQLAPSDVDFALRAAARYGIANTGFINDDERNIQLLAKGRFGRTFTEIVREEYCNAPGLTVGELDTVGGVLANVTTVALGLRPEEMASGGMAISELDEMMAGTDPADQAAAALLVMERAFTFRSTIPDLARLGEPLVDLLSSQHPRVRFAAIWAVVWLARGGWRPPQPLFLRVLKGLLQSWRTDQDPVLRRQATWAITVLPVFKPSLLAKDPEGDAILSQVQNDFKRKREQGWPAQLADAAVVIAYYLGRPLTKSQLADQILRRHRARPSPLRAGEMLSNLGPAGKSRLAKLPEHVRDRAEF